MRFTLFVLAACQSYAMRPELKRAALSKNIARVGDIMAQISVPTDPLKQLNEAASVLNEIAADFGNATEHMDSKDEQLLLDIITLLEETIYGSCDSAHQGNKNSLEQAVNATILCNTEIDKKQTDGDLFQLKQGTQFMQSELLERYASQELARNQNDTTWENLKNHMTFLQDPPVCPGLPARTLTALNAFFADTKYKDWFDDQSAAYKQVADAFVEASEDLGRKVNEYITKKGERNIKWCDWKTTLDTACETFDECFDRESTHYNDELVPEVTEWMNQRKTVKKAGDTMIHQIKFLLGKETDQNTPEIDTSRYTIVFPELPVKTLCDKTPLSSSEWDPAVDPAVDCKTEDEG